MKSSRILILILLFIGFYSNILAQKSSFDSYSITWLTEDQKKVTPYSEEFFLEEEIGKGEVPIFRINKELSGSPKDLSANLSNAVYTNFLGSLDFEAELTSEFQIISEVKYGGDQSYGVIEIVPFRKNSFGQVEKLESFNLNIATRGVREFKPRSRAAGNSVLSEGTWIKIRIERDGIYRLNRSFFDDNGINSSDINPNAVNVYGNTGDQLPFDNSEFRADDLVLNPIEFVGDEDSNFENGEYFIFYGDGPDSWKYEPGEDQLNYVPSKHDYTSYAHYFIRTDDIQTSRIQTMNVPSGVIDYTSDSFDDFVLHETESINLIKSGRNWYGENFNLTTELDLDFNFPNLIPESSVMRIAAVGRSIGGESTFQFSLNSGESTSFNMSAINTGSPIAEVIDREDEDLLFTPTSDNVELDISFDKFSPDSEGWLDYVAIQCRRELQMFGNFMSFRDQAAISANITEYRLEGVTNLNGFKVWNISNPTNVQNVSYETELTQVNFLDQSTELSSFVAFNNSSFQTPEYTGVVENQNLHSLTDVDMIILSNVNFLAPAEELAEIHRARGLVVEVVAPYQVYNEFSSGSPDITAIKMLMKMLYDDAAGDQELAPKFLCLIGDGTYRNREIDGSSPYIISFHSEDSWSPTKSFISDDYYAFLDDNESESTTDKMDVGVGRIIARSESEAFQMVDKVRRYLSENSTQDGGAACIGDGTNSTYGAWRNKIVYVSDDQDGNGADGDTHMRHSEILIDTVLTSNNEFNIKKIYSDAYEQTSTPGGERYVQVNDEIKRAVQDGALLVNYIGHGGEKGWAHERILDIPTIRNWTNSNRMPIFMTATCELTRYDDPEFLSAGELTFLNPDGGAIAMLTTTRIVFSGQNLQIAKVFYNNAFGSNSETVQSLGEVYMRTKNGVTGTNQKNFSLIGDPAITIAHPKKEVFTTMINGQDVSLFNDTLKALELVTLSGYVGDEFGQVLEDFNGFVYPSVFDKERVVITLANDMPDGPNILPYDFTVTENVLYNGKASVTNGQFEFTFVIPRDINFQVGNGKISYYAVDGSVDGHGAFSEFKIGGSLENAELNEVGPEIELFLNDESFVDGGLTNEVPILLAKLQDENGINTAGNGIGHDLKITIDQNSSQAIILNDYYEADEDSYQSGQVRFQLSELAPGTHTITLKAWDTHNNSSESTIEFVVVEESELSLDQIYNYPNPFTTSTEFMFEHNAACNYLDVQIQVFTVGGNLVKTINERIQSSGYRVNGIMWDGLDDYGDELARGVYVYKVKIKTPEGRKAEEFQKLVILK